MDEKSFHGIAGCRIVSLGVHHDLDSFVQVAVLVKVCVANAIGVSQHRN